MTLARIDNIGPPKRKTPPGKAGFSLLAWRTAGGIGGAGVAVSLAYAH